jgi:hypothetical protein
MSEADERVFEFFRLFSRFEYALKAAGFWVKPGGQTEFEAKPAWDDFANVIGTRLPGLGASQELQEAWAYLRDHPARKQMVRGGVLAWDDVARGNESETMFVFVGIRRIRNNLFHGGKAIPGTERDEKLLSSATLVLRSALDLRADVKQAFTA